MGRILHMLGSPLLLKGLTRLRQAIYLSVALIVMLGRCHPWQISIFNSRITYECSPPIDA